MNPLEPPCLWACLHCINGVRICYSHIVGAPFLATKLVWGLNFGVAG